MSDAIVVTVIIICAVILFICKYFYKARTADAPVNI